MACFVGLITVAKAAPTDEFKNTQTDRYMAAIGNADHLFRKNSGQWDPNILYRSLTTNSSVTFYQDKISFGLQRNVKDPFRGNEEDPFPKFEAEYLVWDLIFENANMGAPQGLNPESRNVSYIGPGQQEASRMYEYSSLIYPEIYNGVDLMMYSAEEGKLKYDVLVKKGANISEVKMRYDGIEGLRINEKGELVLSTEWGEFREAAPYSYQIIDGKKVEVDVRYKIEGKSVGYEIFGKYDPNTTLVIDPIYVDWSTFFYGEYNNQQTWGWTWILDIDIDDEEAVYITGMTTEDYPQQPGAYDTSNESYEGFVAKISKDGDSLLWFTYIGSSSWEYCLAITVNELHEPVIAGITTGADFPTTPGAYDRSGKSCGTTYCYQGFVTKFNDSGTKLKFSTFLTGTNGVGTWNIDWIRGLAINPKGEVFVCGNTVSTDFPTTNGAFQTSFGGGGTYVPGQDWSIRGDGFLTKFKADGSDIIFSTLIGGAGNDCAADLFVNESDEIYVVGTTASNNFPTTPAAPVFNTAARGVSDGWVAKFKADGSGVLFSVMIGGTGAERFEGIYANERSQPYVAGISGSSDFPVSKNAYQKRNAGGDDYVILKLPRSGTNILYSTYLGGGDNESSWNSAYFSNIKITANVREEAIISGVTRSKNFPVTSDALQAYHKSKSTWGINLTIAKLSFGGDKLLYGSYFGGSQWEYPGAVKTKKIGCVSFILSGGLTASPDYPTTKGAYKEDPKTSSTWSYSGYVSKFRDTLYTEPIELALKDTIIDCDRVYEVVDAKNRGADIQWSHGPTDQMIILRDTGTYWVQATYGCDTVRDTLRMELEYRPIVPVLGADTIYCDTFPDILLDAKNDTILATYEWQDQSTKQTYKPTGPGKYSVTINTPHCGSKTDDINIKLLNTPKLNFTDSTFCDKVDITLDAKHDSDEVVYRWSTGDSTQTITISDTGTYYAVVENFCGLDSNVFKYDQIFTPDAMLPEDSIFCDVVDWVLHQGKEENQETYYWTDGSGTIGYSILDSMKVTQTGTFKVLISNKCGSDSDYIDIGLITTPEVILADTIYDCDEVNEVLRIGKKDNEEEYKWSTGEKTSVLVVSNSGWYSVTSKNKCGLDKDSVLIILKETPEAILPDDSVFCDDINIVLNALMQDPEATYEWSSGQTTPSLVVTDEGTYSVTVTNRCGVSTDEMVITKIYTPSVDLGPDQVFCGNIELQTFNVATENNMELYDWSTGATVGTETLGEGKHWVTVSNKCGVSSDTVVLRVSPYPIVDLGPDTILCGNFVVPLDAGNPGMTYLWEPTGETTQTIAATLQTVYKVTVTNEDGCASADEFEIGSDCISSYYIPTGFSPNSDGINDVFRPTLVNYEKYTLIIFNRWGEIMFESEEPNQGWDGTFNGQAVPTGMYFYSIRFITTEDGNFKTVNGPLNVVK